MFGQAMTLGLVLGLLSTPLPAQAAVSEAEAKRLETDLTPYGAERAGNAAGTIPGWEGGLTAPPPGIGYEPGGHHPDPFAADAPLFSITPANMAQYDAQLTNGHKALLTAYPGSFSMNVYPTRRSCAYPPHVYQAVARNARSARMVNDGNGITGATMAVPFPIPQSAREILWNHELNYRGFRVQRMSANIAPARGGDFTAEIGQESQFFSWSDPAIASTEELNNIIYYFLRESRSPSAIAGNLFLGQMTLDQVVEDRHTWGYKPGERKVKRLSGLKYDAPANGANGIRTIDGIQIFSGGGDLYEWESFGKTERIIPYNTYRYASPDLEYKDIIRKGHLNTDVVRYELHRVWEIEGKLKPGKSHSVAQRRRFYQDEDTWIIVSTALYGDGDKLSRAQEAFVSNYYEQPICISGSDVVYDVPGGVFHVMGMRNQEPQVNFNADIDRDFFTAESMRRLGIR